MTGLLRGVVVAVLVGGATVVLSSCSGDPGPMVTETRSPTATVVATTPSPSATPSGPSEEELLAQIPENARGEDFMSASNFAKFFVKLYPDMMANQDPALFEYLSDEACVFCRNALDGYESLVASGGTMEGGEVTVQEGLPTGGLQEDGTTNSSFDAETTETRFLDSEGNVTSTIPGRSGRLGVSLRYEDDHWVVLGVGSEAA